MCIFVTWADLMVVSKDGFSLSEMLISVCVCVYLHVYWCLVNHLLNKR